MQINGKLTNLAAQTSKTVGDFSISKGKDGAYTLNLGEGDDKVSIKQNAKGSWDINVNGKNRLTLSDKEMAKLTINGNGGDDRVTVDGDLKNPININGGAGKDSVSLGIDKTKMKPVDKSMVNFDPGKRYEGDTFEYKLAGAKGGNGDPLARTITTRTETYK